MLGRAIEDQRRNRGTALRLSRLGPRAADASALLADPESVVLVATSAGEVVAFAILSGRGRVLEAVWVAPERRRQGIATSLVEVAEELCASISNECLSVVVAAGSRAEKSLYETRGYRGELIVMTKTDPG